MIRIVDFYNQVWFLNPNHIISVREFLPPYDEDLKGVKSAIQFGSGFVDEIYLDKTIDEVYKIIEKN